jgi:Cu/Ag efflux pump CusA
MAALGFSLNNLTLFGLVLAIGIVVDDAIVVVEAVEHHIEHGPLIQRRRRFPQITLVPTTNGQIHSNPQRKCSSQKEKNL